MFTKKKAPEGARPLNSEGTVLHYKDKTKASPRKSRYRASINTSKQSRGKRSMYLMTILPDKEDYYIENMEDEDERADVFEWWAENTVDFLNELQLVYSMLTAENDAWVAIVEKAQRDVRLGYPKNVQYMWKTNRDASPKQLPIDVYIDHVMFWVNSQIENEEIFPTEEDIPFPSNFKGHLTKMYKRMFRIFAIMLSNPCLAERRDIDNTLEPCFKHFCYFAWKWDLLAAKETKILDSLTGPLKSKFDRDHASYLRRELRLEH